MKGKLISIVLVFGLVFSVFGISHAEAKVTTHLVYGFVFESAGVGIYNDTDVWTCTNITVYSVDGTIPPAVDDGSEDEGENGVGGADFDKFAFNAGWNETATDKEGICIGEAQELGIDYTFITNFTYIQTTAIDLETQGEIDVWRGDCGFTEWEPIPTPARHARAPSWLNISIPKFQNPQSGNYDNLTTNADNVIGFAIYRYDSDTWQHIGNATYSDDTHYFHNDAGLLPENQYVYKCAPIARGGYVTYGRSQNLTIPPYVDIEINAPVGDEHWSGNSTHNITYEITGGTAPYDVTFWYRVMGTGNWVKIDNTTKNVPGEHDNPWTTDLINAYVALRATVSDRHGETATAEVIGPEEEDYLAYWVQIDSTTPTISSVAPANGSEVVGITENIVVVFSKEMDTNSTEFTIEPSVNYTMPIWQDNKMTIVPELFTPNQTYTCTINATAKDLSTPAHNLESAYTWSFKTTLAISSTVVAPLAGSVWAGNLKQTIKYKVGGGKTPYTIYVNYTVNEVNTNITSQRYSVPGEKSWEWNVPDINDGAVVITIEVVDNEGITCSASSGQFTIDSGAPTVIGHGPLSDATVDVTHYISITFSEPMDMRSVEAAFTTNPAISILRFYWASDYENVRIEHDGLTAGTIDCTLGTGAKDRSSPGNTLAEAYTWSFIAAVGRGHITVTLSYPDSIEIGKTYTLSIKLSNKGAQAYNTSGVLTVKVNLINLDTNTPTEIYPEELAYPYELQLAEAEEMTLSFTLKIPDYGRWQIVIEIRSSNSGDIIGDGLGIYSKSYTEVFEKEETQQTYWTGLLLLILIIILAYIYLSHKKKAAATPATPGTPKEEEEKASEEPEEESAPETEEKERTEGEGEE